MPSDLPLRRPPELSFGSENEAPDIGPSTFGNVESASTFQDNSVWRTDVAYSYSIGNEFYAGEFQLRSSSERKATERELRWKGQKIGVRYSPRSPKISVVRTEDQAGLYGGAYACDGFPS